MSYFPSLNVKIVCVFSSGREILWLNAKMSFSNWFRESQRKNSISTCLKVHFLKWSVFMTLWKSYANKPLVVVARWLHAWENLPQVKSAIEASSFRDSGTWLHDFVVSRPVFSEQGSLWWSGDIYLMVAGEQKIVTEEDWGALGQSL